MADEGNSYRDLLRVFVGAWEEAEVVKTALISKGILTIRDIEAARSMLRPTFGAIREGFENIDQMEGARLDEVLTKIDSAAGSVDGLESASTPPSGALSATRKPRPFVPRWQPKRQRR